MVVVVVVVVVLVVVVVAASVVVVRRRGRRRGCGRGRGRRRRCCGCRRRVRRHRRGRRRHRRRRRRRCPSSVVVVAPPFSSLSMSATALVMLVVSLGWSVGWVGDGGHDGADWSQIKPTENPMWTNMSKKYFRRHRAQNPMMKSRARFHHRILQSMEGTMEPTGSK